MPWRLRLDSAFDGSHSNSIIHTLYVLIVVSQTHECHTAAEPMDGQRQPPVNTCMPDDRYGLAITTSSDVAKSRKAWSRL
jgi:hypothetical protein